MESFATLKRRTTDLLQSIPQNLPSMTLPNATSTHAPATQKPKGPAPMKGTWEKIDIPPLPLSSHSINVVNGTAYIFGGDTQPGHPATNDMHVVTLPYNSAGADYYTIKAAPPKAYTPPPESPAEPETVAEAIAPAVEPLAAAEQAEDAPSSAKGKEKDLDDVPLPSPTTGADPSFDDDDEEEEEEEQDEVTPTTSASAKGKQPEEPLPPSASLPLVPGPRAGHATATLGHRIFLFGGRNPSTSQPLNEHGRVWVFDTRTHAWTFLDPVPPAPGVTLTPTPAPRHGHAATATDRPRDFASRAPKRNQTWMAWAQGDSAEVGTPQAPIVGNVALHATDDDYDGFGTFFVHGGIVAPSSIASPDAASSEEKRACDLWAFDVRSRIWIELPAAPGPARAGAAMCVSKSRLFRFGGHDGSGPIGGQLDFVHLEVEMFDDGNSRGEVCVRARGGWQSIVAGASGGETEIPLVAAQEWPAPRGFAGLETVTSGAGREYLLLVGGEAADGVAERGREGTTTSFFNDVWAFQVPPLGMTAASVRDAMWQALGKPTGEGKWNRLQMGPYDDDNDDGEPLPRGYIATAAMGELEESGILVWGGVGSGKRHMSDGWILRLGE
ncbi:hypothetical protein VD0002_g9743 [Verticillium dahliae]|uniref:Kelch domain-containing protein n=2 Tax=Verticillium dahliae TaxID=27337 RepID=G2XER2_VERDV|nr:uncharacterized protein VDAG_08647 [Verticillium dahliae VdLs.17]KAF3349018.1 hypothetical protein VdG2_02707 [Verticillium dahliae VDG2]KAF3357895.1 hypothetical protein VdG1_05560 [Verticillium dahliae VDG1]KAH6709710.1 hypothetical protein EV126DRAFT_1104 [Verticillium dahliae]EGY18313.1 hypothetical protein VDAG_08647 [Verticillium dahliae VdLs.17]PNH29429.1 hypothetical protein BJF96_g7281 [Verticillium dahliae]